ncbi:M20/M25/M40 family metallo-hydrolase [Roseisolibacter sp. H3M3-2]|uniref:M20/M25/M40 family metallo-hydrolase n=1 Tax=Roseisolibacter sp. H3M3-2 TaxID=3031323 RepID=UPI0023DB636A|nr:M20/M25/M40 family metallo-hydrolase [Roseisolibacter sp. H3M3-2]MDF1501750.1 M20/M25/M40 family metallo-hydrolase [Roseisolibacter sp. H3M3-2]
MPLPRPRPTLGVLGALGALLASAAGAQAHPISPATTRSAVPAAAVARAAGRTDPAVLARIREEGLERSRVMATATTLADVFGPRLAGSDGYRAAAEWTRATLAGYGLRDARLEPWGTRGGAAWTVERHSLELEAPYYARLVAYPYAWSPGVEGGVVRGTPLLLPALRGEEDVAKVAGQVRGRIVMVGAVPPDPERFAPLARRWTDAQLDSLARVTDPGSPKDYWDDAGGYAENVRRRLRVQLALKEAGALAMLTPSRSAASTQVAGYQAYDTDVRGAVPALSVARDDYARLVTLVQRAESAGRPAPTVALELRTRSEPPRTRADSQGVNVVAELPGSDPALRAEVVMVGGHFDSWTAGTGATDNAAGAAVAMEALRILQTVGARPRRTIRLALWDGEEHEDYHGSLGWVKAHLGDPETMRLGAEHGRVSAYFNFDNGTGRIRGLWMQGNAAARDVLRPLLAPFADLGATTLTLANTGSTDHMPFVGVGVPAFTFLQDPIDYETRTHHTAADVGANLLEDDLKQAAVVTAAMLLQVADLDQRVPRAPLPRPREAKVSK